MAFDYTTGNPNNLTGGALGNMLDIQGPFLDLKSFLNQRIAAVPTLVTNLPAGPVDGQEVYYLADSANGIVWHLRYRAASGSAYKWEFVGGRPLSASVATAETTSSTIYVALATAGPSIVLPLAGDWDIAVNPTVTTGAAAGAGAVMSYDVGATLASDADAAQLTSTVTGGDRITGTPFREQRKTVATAGVSVVAKYRTTVSAITTFQNRRMIATPVRVG